MSDRAKHQNGILFRGAVIGALAAGFLAMPESAFAQKKPRATPAPKSRSKAQAAAKKKENSASSSRNRNLEMQRSQSTLPQAASMAEPKKVRSLEVVKPPRSGSFYESGTKEAEYERILDEEIKMLYKLSQQNRTSANRGEIWLRLGERYVEKSRLIDLREQADYERKLKDFAEKKTKIRPQLNMKPAREYNEKAVQLYEWFIKDFPRDAKVDQALFFLGYNHFELGNAPLGERYYSDLVKRFPDSVFITESHFALGEYYFENEAWKQALDNYMKVIKVKKARLNTFALYKSSWCLYRLNRTKLALQALERVVRQSRANERDENTPGGRKAVNKLRLGQEALKDFVPFYAEAGDPSVAATEFLRLSGNEKQANQMLERLAYIYADKGDRKSSTFIFKELIGKDPTGERSAEYQYQIVLSHATHDPKEFRKELEIWLDAFGPQSLWAKENAKNEKLVGDATRLQETTLRNYVLQQHQTAQNSRSPYSQQLASAAYIQYFKYFMNSPKIVEMRFFHAELLFDMGKHEEAARSYTWVAEKEPQGPYKEKAIINTLLALEKDLPSEKEIEKKRGNSLEKQPFDPPVERFEKAALRYIQAFPKGGKTSDIKRRLGVLYYSYNQFDDALAIFEQIIRESPKSDNAVIAGNLTLDIYKLKNDMDGLSKKGEELLAIPAIAGTPFGVQIRSMLATAGYLRAEKLQSSDAGKAAKEFETFANNNKQSELAAAARFKAAANYEKAGDLVSSARMHAFVLATPSNDPKIKAAQSDSRIALARIYQQTGQLEMAAKQYLAIAAANPKDPKAVNAYFNAGVLFAALGETNEAIRAYQTYYDNTKRGDRVEILFEQAELMNKKGQISKSRAAYEKYLDAGPRSEPHMLKATYMMAHIYQQQGAMDKAKTWFQKTGYRFKNASKAGREEAVKYAAEARFFLAQDTLKELLAIRFGTSDKTQAKAAAEIKRLREKYISEMKEVIRFDNGPYIVAALASGGKMFESIAGLFARIPVPKGFQADEAAKYKELIQMQVNGFKNEAKNSYKAAVDKSQELEVYTEWSRIAVHGLGALGGGTVDAGEIVAEARVADWMGL